jgi:large subunit ribosomal protein L21
MYAIARVAGKQFRLETDATVKVPKLPLEPGATVEIKDILFATDGQNARTGAQAKGISATAKVVEHGRDDKIMVHRKKRRKGFQVTKGHRQGFTLLHIEKIEGM